MKKEASASQKWAFEIPPEPISESQISEIKTSQLVVVGEGLSGLCTALSAAEEGVETVIITASSKPVGRGGSVYATYSKAMEAAGYPGQELDNFYLQELSASSFNVDQRKWYSFYNNSETAMNWLIDMLELDGVRVVLEDGKEDDPEVRINLSETHDHFSPMGSVLPIRHNAGIEKTSKKTFGPRRGASIYNTVDRPMVRDEGGTGRDSSGHCAGSKGKYIK